MKIDLEKKVHTETKGLIFKKEITCYTFIAKLSIDGKEHEVFNKYLKMENKSNVLFFEYDYDIAKEEGKYSNDYHKQEVYKEFMRLAAIDGVRFGVQYRDLLKGINKQGYFEKQFLYEKPSTRDQAVERFKNDARNLKSILESYQGDSKGSESIVL